MAGELTGWQSWMSERAEEVGAAAYESAAAALGLESASARRPSRVIQQSVESVSDRARRPQDVRASHGPTASSDETREGGWLSYSFAPLSLPPEPQKINTQSIGAASGENRTMRAHHQRTSSLVTDLAATIAAIPSAIRYESSTHPLSRGVPTPTAPFGAHTLFRLIATSWCSGALFLLTIDTLRFNLCNYWYEAKFNCFGFWCFRSVEFSSWGWSKWQ